MKTLLMFPSLYHVWLTVSTWNLCSLHTFSQQNSFPRAGSRRELRLGAERSDMTPTYVCSNPVGEESRLHRCWRVCWRGAQATLLLLGTVSMVTSPLATASRRSVQSTTSGGGWVSQVQTTPRIQGCRPHTPASRVDATLCQLSLWRHSQEAEVEQGRWRAWLRLRLPGRGKGAGVPHPTL